MKKRILSLMLVFDILATLTVSLPITVSAASSGTCGENLTWTLDDSGTLTISGSGKMTDWESYDEAPWYSLRTSITSVTIKSGVTSIDDDAFYYCRNLASVTIPNSVTSIGNYAFDSCERLTSITVDGDNTNYSSIDGNLFNKDKTALIQYAIGKTDKQYAIPDGVITIGNRAFYGCDSLTSVTIPDSVTRIGDGAFWGSSLTSVNIGRGVISINNNAFAYCNRLTSITIPDSVTSIGGCAFGGCRSLTSMTIPDNVISIGDGGFIDCDSLTYVTIGSGVTSIGDSVFYDCDSLASITVDEDNMNYSSLDGNLFNKDKTVLIQYAIGKSDNKYAIPDSVTSIGYYAFAYCSSLTSVTISDGAISIGYEAFYWCSSLTRVNIGNGVTSIGDRVFWGCGSLTSVTIPDSIKSIGDRVFFLCDNLNTIYYAGTQAQWGGISIGSNNQALENAAIEYRTITNDGNLKVKDLEVKANTIDFKVEPKEIGNGSFIYIGIYDNLGKLISIKSYPASECDRVSLKNEGKTLKVMWWGAGGMNALADRIKINLDN
ncbi:MAG: leucine-rich repeat domain-containing protein [Clostridia bacterium]|nr:leucine-rich repeat domain-containing protein [Clostridia bacterium]